jgi:hypothetical protein
MAVCSGIRRGDTEIGLARRCKLFAHNLCVLIQEEHELGIESVFWQCARARELPADQ